MLCDSVDGNLAWILKEDPAAARRGHNQGEAGRSISSQCPMELLLDRGCTIKQWSNLTLMSFSDIIKR
jgi:hypothetical protein